MKKILSAFMLFITMSVFGQETLVLDKIKWNASGSTAPAVIFKSNNNIGLPIIIFGHGKGESGANGTAAIWNNGLPAVLKAGFRPPYPCIIIAPQQGSWSPPASWLPHVLKDAYARFQYDTTRIWLTGISAGGDLTWGGVLDLTPEFAKKIAAIAPLSGNSTNNNWNNIGRFKENKTPVWAVFGDATTTDGTEWSIRNNGIPRINQINAQTKGLATVYIRKGLGHCCYVDVYNGTMKDSTGKTIWDFFKDKRTGPGTIIVPAPVITVPPLQKGTVGNSFSYIVTASNNPVFGANNLPAGLNITTTGQISGIPTLQGITTSTITAKNEGGSATSQIQFEIAPKPKEVSVIQTIVDYNNPSCSIKITYYSDGTFIKEKL